MMNHSTTKIQIAARQLLKLASVVLSSVAITNVAHAAVHGITGGATTPTFNLTASASTISQPDGAVIYAWGYGCTSTAIPAASAFLPAGGNCPLMQLPGPTMIVTEGDVVTVNLTNLLPPGAGATSIIFPGMAVTATGSSGVLTSEATNGGGTVSYTFTAAKPGTYAYYSGTQPDLQIEMGLSGAMVVLPNAASATAAGCKSMPVGSYSLAASAYGHPDSCYDREYLFQFTELSSNIHEQVKAQVDACPIAPCPQIAAIMEPYRPNYFMVNGRSMPDNMDVAYAPGYPNQPYNGNPHMHPGENVLMRVIGQGHWQHPFHFHGNHARVLARDASMLLSSTDATKLAGPLLFTIPTVSGQTVDAIFTWTGQGLNWDVYGTQAHTCNTKPLPAVAGDPAAQSAGFDPVTHEYCGDHGKPFPVTPPDPTIVVNGQWYAGTPYLGLQSAGNQTPEAPGTLNQNPQGGYAYMWHSHNEREITTNDVFPGGMMMMLLIDPFSATIDETQ
jgi:FtsP/CotA-like multicopper oxidase with cupredoxin domain